MKRTLMFMCLCAALALISGCGSAQAACPGGNCSLGWGVWSPWVGGYYWQSPCAGGKCRTAAKPAAPPEEPDHFRESTKMAEEPAPEAADTAPEIVEEPVIEAKPSLCEIVSEIVNRHRERLGLPALEIDPLLCQGCEEHSVWMAANGFRHAYGIGGRECIATGIRSPEAVINLWLGSDGHRAILLGTGKSIGVGRCGSYWTLRVR